MVFLVISPVTYAFVFSLPLNYEHFDYLFIATLSFVTTHLFGFPTDDGFDQKLPTAIDYSDITEVADEDEAEVLKYRDAMATMKTTCEGAYTEMLCVNFLPFLRLTILPFNINNNNKSISIVPRLQVTQFKGAVTKQILKMYSKNARGKEPLAELFPRTPASG